MLLFSAWQHFELLRHGYRLEQMQQERASEEAINRHLRLEIETLRSPARIERLATSRLRMVAPAPDEAIVIERVIATPAAAAVRRRAAVGRNGVSRGRPACHRLAHDAEAPARRCRRGSARCGRRRSKRGSSTCRSFRYADLSSRAERQQSRTIEAPAKRGDILDRHGRILAYSVDADTIYAVPNEIGDLDATTAAVCRALGDCDAKDRQAMADRIRKGRYFAYVRRQVSPDQATRVAALQLEGHRVHQGEQALLSRTRIWRRTCSATSASTTSAWAASRRPTTR